MTWTWVAGDNTINSAGVYCIAGVASAASKPGARRNPACWVDSRGRLWMVGGLGFDEAGGAQKTLSDLWMYDFSSNLWTFISGPSIGNDVGVVTTVGDKSFTPWPGGHRDVKAVVVPNNRVWMFGGAGMTPNQTAEAKIGDFWSILTP